MNGKRITAYGMCFLAGVLGAGQLLGARSGPGTPPSVAKKRGIASTCGAPSQKELIYVTLPERWKGPRTRTATELWCWTRRNN